MGRDKFAAMASRASNPTGGDETSTSTSATSEAAAAVAANANINADGNVNVDETNPTISAPGTPSTSTVPSSGSTAAAAAATPRRDKLAALASRVGATQNSPSPAVSSAASSAVASTGRGNKFAAMAAKPPPGGDDGNDDNVTNQIPSSTGGEQKDDTSNDNNDNNIKNKQQSIKERLSKRQEILQNLDRAEELTCQLLEIAHKTATELQQLSTSPNLSELSKSYRSVLQELHPLLCNKNTQDLIQPYRNHSNETKQSMYAARVEMRLARERAQVLKAFTEMAHFDAANASSNGGEGPNATITSTGNNKRPREE